MVRREYRALARPGEALEKVLGALERDIMEEMWSAQGRSVRDVLAALNARRGPAHPLAYTTVMTVMSRLADKGMLRRKLVGKAHEYEAAESREAFLARTSQDIARCLIADFGEAAVAGFLCVLEDVAPERLAKLRRQSQRRGQT